MGYWYVQRKRNFVPRQKPLYSLIPANFDEMVFKKSGIEMSSER